MKKLIVLGLLFLGLMVINCDSSLGSCTVTAGGMSYCYSYSGDTGDATAEDLEKACKTTTGKYSEDDCNISGAVGECKYKTGGLETTAQYGKGFDKDAGKTACEALGGTWK